MSMYDKIHYNKKKKCIHQPKKKRNKKNSQETRGKAVSNESLRI